MKKLGIYLAAFLFAIAPSVAQKVFDKGTVKMEITEIKSADPQMAMQLEMMKGSKTEVIFTEKIQATVADMMGGMVKITSVSNTESDQFDMLMDMMGQKMWINSTISELAKDPQQAAIKNTTVVKVDKTVTKEILGHKCYKVSISSPEMAEMTVEAFVTEDIKGSGQSLIQGFQSVELPGFPLEVTIKNAMMDITMIAKEVTDTVDTAKLNPKKDGFKKMTMEEFKKQMGGMGMGF